MKVGDLVRFRAHDEELNVYESVGILARLGKNPYGSPIWLIQPGGFWRMPKRLEVLSESR